MCELPPLLVIIPAMPPMAKSVLVLEVDVAIVSEFFPLGVFAAARVCLPGAFTVIIIITGSDTVH